MLDALGRAELGVSIVDLLSPNLAFQEVNERDLDESNVNNLIDAFVGPGGKQPWLSPMAVVVQPSWIVPSSLRQRGHPYSALARLELTEEGKKHKLKMLSGHHRKVACERLAAEIKTNLDNAIDDVAALKAKDRLTDKQNNRLDRLSETVTRLTGEWEWMKEYQVIVYDASESHLSLYTNASSHSSCRSHMDGIIQRS